MELFEEFSGTPMVAPTPAHFTPEGKQEWVRFYNEHAKEQVELTGDLSAAWSKLEGYAARLALVIHLTRLAANDPELKDTDAVNAASVRAGVRLSRWFGHEARRIYAMLDESDETQERRKLVELIECKGGSMTARDLMRSSRQYLTAADATAALDDLAKAGIGQWEDSGTTPQGGRPTRQLTLVDTVDTDRTPLKPGEDRGCVNVNSVSGAENADRASDPPVEAAADGSHDWGAV